VFESRDPALAERAPAAGHAIVANVGIDFDVRRDSARVMLPDAALAATAPRLPVAVPRAGESANELFQRLRNVVGFAQVEVRGVIGRSKLSRAELEALSIGDIIIPDDLSVRSTESGLGGRVDLVMGPGRGKTRMRGQLVGWDGALYHVQLDEFVAGENGTEEGVSGQDTQFDDVVPAGGEDGGAEAEGAQVLNDVPLPLVVELGRLYLTVREIAALRRGQVIELGRTPSEPVALVVEGHVVGAGKLVNVEGEIGVQITNLQR
jgi:type III secretion system YscQ/HrcQ family protein